MVWMSFKKRNSYHYNKYNQWEKITLSNKISKINSVFMCGRDIWEKFQK